MLRGIFVLCGAIYLLMGCMNAETNRNAEAIRRTANKEVAQIWPDPKLNRAVTIAFGSKVFFEDGSFNPFGVGPGLPLGITKQPDSIQIIADVTSVSIKEYVPGFQTYCKGIGRVPVIQALSETRSPASGPPIGTLIGTCRKTTPTRNRLNDKVKIWLADVPDARLQIK